MHPRVLPSSQPASIAPRTQPTPQAGMGGLARGAVLACLQLTLSPSASIPPPPRLGPCSAFRRELHPGLPHQNFGTWPPGRHPSDQPRRPGLGIFAPPGALGGVTSHPSSGGSPSHCLASVPPDSPHAPLPPGAPPARGHGRGGLRGPPATLTSGRPHLPLSAYGDSPAA